MLSLEYFLKKGQTTLSNALLDNYRSIGMTHEEFLLWIQLYKASEDGEPFADLGKISKTMELTVDEIYLLLNQLVQKQVLAIQSEKNESGQVKDFYDFLPAFQKIEEVEKERIQSDKSKQYHEKIKELYKMFEIEFGRSLSPIEYQRIGQWIEEDKYELDLIQLALREAVLNQVYSLNYIDRILLSWERKKIHSIAQIEQEQKNRQRKQTKEMDELPKGKIPEITLYNWLEED